MAFCALLYNWFPERIPINELKVDTDEDKIKNCELAFQVAFEEAGVGKFLDGEDMITYQDKKSIMVYLNEVYIALQDKPLKFSPSEEWQINYERKMLLDRRAVMEAAARGEVTARSGSPAATRYLSSSLGADSPSSPSVSAKLGGPVKIISTTVVRGGLTPKAGTGSLWGSRLGASGTTPDSPVTPGPGAPGTTSDRPVTAGLGASGTTPDSPVTPGLGASGTTPDSPVTPGLGTSGTSSDRPVAGLGASGTTSDNPVTPGPAVREDPAAELDTTPKMAQRVKQNLGSLWDSKLEEKEEKEKQEKIPTESVC